MTISDSSTQRNGILRTGILSLFLLFLTLLISFQHTYADDTFAQIHLLNLSTNSVCIVLESRDASGKPIFGMVDTGEDEDFPKGTDPRYPLRNGIVQGHGNEGEVLPFLASLGVNSNNLKFLICTHPHSDHIGLAQYIIRKYSPDKVYLMEYSDSMISVENNLWDNQYVYDRAVEACRQTRGVELIQDIADNASLSLGSFSLSLVNYDTDYQTSPKTDANQFCLGVIAEANGHKAFLPSDMDNSDGDLDRLLADYDLANTDVLVSNHHGYSNANPSGYLTTLNPTYYLQAGTYKTMSDATIQTLVSSGSKIYSAAGYCGTLSSLSTDFSGGTVTCNADNTTIFYQVNSKKTVAYQDGIPCTGVFTYNDETYAADENGVLYTSTAWFDPDSGLTYTFDESGKVTDIMQVHNWVLEDKKWYFRDEDGENATGFIYYKENWYYLDPNDNGSMATGWQKIDGIWHYFANWGGILTGWQKYGGSWYYLDPNNMGAMLSDTWFEDKDGYIYHFESWGGANCSTTKVINQISYTFNASCRVSNIAWLDIDGERYLIANSRFHHGWANLNNIYYYLNADGTLKRDELYTYLGCYYYSDKNGVMAANKWVLIDGKWYYFQNWGGAYTNRWFLYKSNWYWLEKDGIMATGWREINGKTYYFLSDGRMVSGKQMIDGLLYEFSPNGDLIHKPEPPAEETDSGSEETLTDSEEILTDSQEPLTDSEQTSSEQDDLLSSSSEADPVDASSDAEAYDGEAYEIEAESTGISENAAEQEVLPGETYAVSESVE